MKNFASEELRQGYVVIPHDATINPTDLPDQAAIMILVTNWWIERCLYGKYLFDPADHILSRPFDRLSISGECLFPERPFRPVLTDEPRLF